MILLLLQLQILDLTNIPQIIKRVNFEDEDSELWQTNNYYNAY